MGQMTARVSDELEATYNRWAAEEKLPRADLIRQVLIEAAKARHEGRATFVRPETAGPADTTRVVTSLDRHTINMDRLSRQMAKRDAELARVIGADSRVVSEARTAIVDDVTKRLHAVAEAIAREEVNTREAVLAVIAAFRAELASVIVNLSVFKQIGTRQDQHTEALNANTAAIERLASEPRTENNLVLRGFTVPIRNAAIAMFFALAAIVTVLAMTKPVTRVATGVGMGMMGGGDHAICRSIDATYHASSCAVTVAGIRVTATATIRQVDP